MNTFPPLFSVLSDEHSRKLFHSLLKSTTLKLKCNFTHARQNSINPSKLCWDMKIHYFLRGNVDWCGREMDLDLKPFYLFCSLMENEFPRFHYSRLERPQSDDKATAGELLFNCMKTDTKKKNLSERQLSVH